MRKKQIRPQGESLKGKEKKTKALPFQVIEGRNAALEAFRSGRIIDRLFLRDGSRAGPLKEILLEAKKQKTNIQFVDKERLSELGGTDKNQGVVAYAAPYAYAGLKDILDLAQEKGEDPFLILLDHIEDPHNLGAIIRTANLAGAHGVVVPKRRAARLSPVVAKVSAGALNYTLVAKVTNLFTAIQELKKKGLWIVCANMAGQCLYDLDLTGPVALVIGNEGKGIGRLVQEQCDFSVAIPVKGKIGSLNASVAAGIFSYEIVRQRRESIRGGFTKRKSEITDESI